MPDKKISIIVPAYNSISCLPRCVRSLRAQTYQNLEILLIDDGSTDKTGELCERLSAEDVRIRFFHKENGGASSARNLGLAKATGDYLGFVDSDDYVEPYFCEKLAKALEEQGCPVAQISRDELAEDGSTLPDVCIPPKKKRFCDSETFLSELLMHRGDCSFCTKLFGREVFAQRRFPEGKLNEDFRLLVEMLQEIPGVLILPEQGYHVVCRQDSTTRTRTKDSFSRVFLDIVDNADWVQHLVDEKYPALQKKALRFGLFQRLDYLLHVPLSQMNRENVFYRRVKRHLRAHVFDIAGNPYLTKKERIYLLLFAGAPRLVREVHAIKMETRRNTDQYNAENKK